MGSRVEIDKDFSSMEECACLARKVDGAVGASHKTKMDNTTRCYANLEYAPAVGNRGDFACEFEDTDDGEFSVLLHLSFVSFQSNLFSIQSALFTLLNRARVFMNLGELVDCGKDPNAHIKAHGLGKCEGDCDDNSDCADGLKCYLRDSLEDVPPGCQDGGDGDISTHNYCYDPDGWCVRGHVEVAWPTPGSNIVEHHKTAPGDFGPDVIRLLNNSRVATTSPTNGCGGGLDGFPLGSVAVIERGVCNFCEKAIAAEKAGAIGVIIYSDKTMDEDFQMRGTCDFDHQIPTVMVAQEPGKRLATAIAGNKGMTVDLICDKDTDKCQCNGERRYVEVWKGYSDGWVPERQGAADCESIYDGLPRCYIDEGSACTDGVEEQNGMLSSYQACCKSSCIYASNAPLPFKFYKEETRRISYM